MSKGKLIHIAPKLYELKSKKSCFKTPSNYFNLLDDKLMANYSVNTNNNIPKSNSFKIPENYLSNLEDIIVSKLNAEGLNKKKLNNEIPTNYFENLEDRIFDRIATEKKTRKVISLNSNFRKIAMVAVAASLLLYFGIVSVFNNTNSVDFNSLTTNEIHYWLDSENILISNDDIASVLNDDEINDLSDNLLTTTYNDDEIIEFLNNSDIESLLIED